MLKKIKLAAAFVFLTKYNDEITHITNQMFNAMIGYYDEQNREPDMVIKA